MFYVVFTDEDLHLANFSSVLSVFSGFIRGKNLLSVVV